MRLEWIINLDHYMEARKTEKANLENINQQIQRVYTEFFEATGKSLKEFDNHEITVPIILFKFSRATSIAVLRINPPIIHSKRNQHNHREERHIPT